MMNIQVQSLQCVSEQLQYRILKHTYKQTNDRCLSGLKYIEALWCQDKNCMEARKSSRNSTSLFVQQSLWLCGCDRLDIQVMSWWVIKPSVFLSSSLRLLDSSTEHIKSDSWRTGGLSVDSMSPTTELRLGEKDSQVRVGGSKSQRGQQQDQPAEAYGALDNSECGRGGSLEGKGGDGVMTGHLKDSGHSFARDEIDSSASSIHRIAGQRVSKETAKISYSEGAGISSGEGSVEPGEGLSPGGGAFLPFRRDPARQPSTTPTQHTMVLLCCIYSKEVWTLCAPWFTL